MFQSFQSVASPVRTNFPIPTPERSKSWSRPWIAGPNGKAFKRLNAIHLLLIGATFELAQRNSCIKEHTLRLWISRFNTQGIDGLIYGPRTGSPRKLEPAQVTEEVKRRSATRK